MHMYNRYIPQPDGSFRRSKLPEPERRERPRPAAPRSCRQEPPKQDPCKAPSAPPSRPQKPAPRPQPPESPCPGSKGVGDFLRQLLPGDFDTSDLMIVLLLLLMAGDQPEERNTALLTLAIYLFL